MLIRLKLLFFIGLISFSSLSVCSSEQPGPIKIELKDNVLNINNEKIKFPAKLEIFTKLLGKEYRNAKGFYDYCTYDDLGILLVVSNADPALIDMVYIYYSKLTREESLPEKMFSGQIILNGAKIDSSFDITKIKGTIPEYNLKKDDFLYETYEGTYKNMTITTLIDEDTFFYIAFSKDN